MSDYIVFDRKPSSDFDCYLVAGSVHSSPERDYKKITVPGRSGELIVDNKRYKNIDITYHVFFYNQDKLESNLSGLKAYLLSRKGYCRLEDTFHPDEYYMAVYSGNIQPTVLMDGAQMARIQLKFNRKPQKYLKYGELVTTFSDDGVIYNPTYYDAQPFIRVYGYGTIEIGDYSIQIAQSTLPYIDIDCERMDAYCGAINCNNLIAVADFPVLVPGASNISLSKRISGVEVKPRWWTV